MRDAISLAVTEPILPSALRESLGVERPREVDELRRALMTRSARPERPWVRAPLAAPVECDLGPSEIVRDAPAARRICEAHHRASTQLLRRGRRQRVGLATLVAAVALTAAVLFTERRLDEALLRLTVVTPALLSLAGLAVLATLGLRDGRRLVALQGERMVRGIDRGSDVPPARLRAFLAAYPTAATAFLACYRAWRRTSAPRAWLA